MEDGGEVDEGREGEGWDVVYDSTKDAAFGEKGVSKTAGEQEKKKKVGREQAKAH